MRKIGVILVVIAAVFMSCATTVTIVDKVPEKTVQDPLRPLWTKKFPSEAGFYVGIGSSNTGNEAEDLKTAEERARANIAAAISTKIHEEVNVVTKDSSSGASVSYAEDRVSAEVEQSLTGVETVDTYSSKTAGAWVYMRLSKALWEKTQKEEMAQLISRITDFLAPVLDDYDRPFITRVQQLVKARKLILESPYPGMLKTVFYGEKGALIDIIDSFLKEHLDSLSIKVHPVSSDLSVGKSMKFTVMMQSTVSSRVGSVPFEIVNASGPSGDEKQIFSGITDPEGTYAGELKYTALAMGKNHLRILPDRNAIGIDDTFKSLIIPEKEMVVDLQGITLGLDVVLPEGMSVPGIQGGVTSLFSRKNLPFKVDSRRKNINPEIKFEFVITDFPKVLKDAPSMAQVYAVVSLIKNGKTMYSYESKPVKDGGITPDQAHKRAADKLMKALSRDDTYVQEIMKALSLN